MAATVAQDELVRDLGERRRRRGARRSSRALVVWMNNTCDRSRPDGRPDRRRASTPRPVRSPSATGTQTMDTYIDFMCPVCNQFEQVVRRGDRRPGGRRHDHPQHPPDLDPRPRLAGHRVLHSCRERDVLRRGRRRRRIGAVHAGDVREPAGGGLDRSDRRADPRDRRRASASPGSTRASTTASTPDYVTDDDREDSGRAGRHAASARRRSRSTARSSRTRRCPSRRSSGRCSRSRRDARCAASRVAPRGAYRRRQVAAAPTITYA